MKEKSIVTILATALLAATLWGCVPSHFSLTDSDNKFQKNKIAVIAGLKDDFTVVLADRMAREIAQKTTFKVMSTRDAAAAMGRYPIRIRGPYSAAYFGIDEDYTYTDLRRIKEIQQRLGVDYLYVMWAPSVVNSGGATQVYIITQLFEFPEGKEIAHASYLTVFLEKYALGFGPRSPEEAIDDSCKRAVKAVIAKTGRGRAVAK